MLSSMTTSGDDAADVQTEITRLREENEKLKSQRAAERSGAVRATAVVVLIVLGSLLTVPGLAAPWLRAQLLNTDRYVETMQPIIEDPAVIDYVATRITDDIFARVDVESLLAQNLPPRLSFAAGPLTGQIESKSQELVVTALSSEEFVRLWDEVNRKAHGTIVNYLESGDSSTLSVNSSNQLVLDLAPIVTQVKQRLADAGLTFVNDLPTVAPTLEIVVGDASFLVQARQAVRALQIAGWLFPVLAIGCFALAILLSRQRRRALTWSGIGLAAGALLVGILLVLGRSGFLNAMADANVPVDASTEIFDALVRFLRNSLRVTALVGLLIAVFAVVTGPTSGAIAVRRTIGGALTETGQRSGFSSGGFGKWLAGHRTAVIVGLIVLGAIMFLAVDGPTPAFVLTLVLVGLLLLAVVQVLVAAAPPVDEEATRVDSNVRA